MRVISGSARGLKLKTLEGEAVRPTADRLKEALFSMILPYIYEANFLDIFSGSGAIGIEALSRGANKATFIDSSKDSVNIIKYNLEKAKFQEKAQIYTLDCINAIQKLHEKSQVFDIIFMDPPYQKGFVSNVLNEIQKYDILAEDGLIICEQHVKDEIPKIDKFYIHKLKEYKITKFVFLKKAISK